MGWFLHSFGLQASLARGPVCTDSSMEQSSGTRERRSCRRTPIGFIQESNNDEWKRSQNDCSSIDRGNESVGGKCLFPTRNVTRSVALVGVYESTGDDKSHLDPHDRTYLWIVDRSENLQDLREKYRTDRFERSTAKTGERFRNLFGEMCGKMLRLRWSDVLRITPTRISNLR